MIFLKPLHTCFRMSQRSVRISATSNWLHRLKIALAAVAATAATPASATPCAFGSLGEGRVTAVIDARNFRLEDGRDVRLAGIVVAFPEKAGGGQTQALAA